MAVLLLLGFASGLPLFLTSRTLQLWMQDAKIDIGAITLFGLVGLPYSLKFIWSPLLDRFMPPFLGLRRGWLLLTQIGLVLAIGAMALQQPAQNAQVLQLLAINALIIAFFSATQDIAGDAYRTDVLEASELEMGASVWVLGYRVSLFITSSLALILADLIPWNAVYFLMTAIMGVGVFATLWAPEAARTNLENTAPISLKDGLVLLGLVAFVTSLFTGVVTGRLPLTVFYWIVAALLLTWVAIGLLLPKRSQNTSLQTHAPQSLQDAIVLPFQDYFQRFGLPKGSLILLFILLYKLGDALVGISGNLFLRELGFSKTDIGAIQGGMGLIATTVGVVAGGVIMTRLSINRSLWVFGILQLLSNLGYYGLALLGKNYSALVLAVNIEHVCAGLVTVATVAFLMTLCSHNFTTTQFALFSSLMAISRDILSSPAGELAKATGWSTFFLLTLLAATPGLLLLPIVAPWNSGTVAESSSN